MTNYPCMGHWCCMASSVIACKERLWLHITSVKKRAFLRCLPLMMTHAAALRHCSKRLLYTEIYLFRNITKPEVYAQKFTRRFEILVKRVYKDAVNSLSKELYGHQEAVKQHS